MGYFPTRAARMGSRHIECHAAQARFWKPARAVVRRSKTGKHSGRQTRVA